MTCCDWLHALAYSVSMPVTELRRCFFHLALYFSNKNKKNIYSNLYVTQWCHNWDALKPFRKKTLYFQATSFRGMDHVADWILINLGPSSSSSSFLPRGKLELGLSSGWEKKKGEIKSADQRWSYLEYVDAMSLNAFIYSAGQASDVSAAS